MESADSSVFLYKTACPECGSSDNLAVYSDHKTCFTPGCTYYERESAPRRFSGEYRPVELLETQLFTSAKRGLSPVTTAKFGYGEGNLNGARVHIANHTVDGVVIGQKIRTADKTFSVRGKLAPLWGMHLWPTGGKKVVVTEGEIDAMSVSQAQDNKWPVVSIPNGAPSAAASFKKAIEWLIGFDEVIIMFDMDDVGREAAKAAAAVLPPGKAKIASLPLKDANELLVAGRVDAIIRAIWDAAPYRPDGVVSLAECIADALRPTERGRPWPYPHLTEYTYGRRDGEIYTFGAGTGVGKTDFLTECIAYDVSELGLTVGVLFLEQDKRETVQRIAGKIANKRFHVPDGSWSQEDLAAGLQVLSSRGNIHLFDSFGATDWDTIESRIEFMVQGLGCKHIYLDHLTAMAAESDDVDTELKRIMARMAGQCKRLGYTMHLVSHLNTPKDGKPHEEGGRVTIRNFMGSRAIGFWSYFMFGMERDQQDEDLEARHTTTLRCLKDRYTGQGTGQVTMLGYDAETGRISESGRAASAPTKRNPASMFPEVGDVGF